MNSEPLHVEHQTQAEELSDNDALDFPYQQSDEDLTLPIIDRQFVEEIPPPFFVRYLLGLLEPDESIFMLFRLNSSHTFEGTSGKTQKVPLWTIMTGTRLLLVAASEQGDALFRQF